MTKNDDEPTSTCFGHFHTMPMRAAGGQNEADDLYAVRVVISIKFVLQVVVLYSAVWC